MRELLHRFGYILSFPFRLIAWPYVRIREFIDQEPEDAPISDAISRTFENPSLLIEHINDLRYHLFRALLALAATTLISFVFANKIFAWLAKPIGGIEALQSIEVTESIGAFMRVSLLSGVALASPIILFELFTFANPGLQRRERTLILIAAPISALLFLSGIAFAYYAILPAALPFLLNFMGITTVPRPASYIRFVTSLMFWIGLSFQFPLIIYTLAAMGVVKAETLKQGWRYAIVVIAILAAAATPTIDPVNMALVMAPMIVLYFLSIILAHIAQRSRQRPST